jgi:hypothetical protein
MADRTASEEVTEPRRNGVPKEFFDEWRDVA